MRRGCESPAHGSGAATGHRGGRDVSGRRREVSCDRVFARRRRKQQRRAAARAILGDASYVVLAPSHRDAPSAENLADPKAWETRARDLAFLIDALPEVEQHVPALAGKLDAAKLGVGGHAYGVHGGAACGSDRVGASVAPPKAPKTAATKAMSFADARPKRSSCCHLRAAGCGAGPRTLVERRRPLLLVTGSRDGTSMGQDASWRIDAFRLSPPGDKFCLFLRGGSHLSFTGRYAEPGATVGTGREARLPRRRKSRSSRTSRPSASRSGTTTCAATPRRRRFWIPTAWRRKAGEGRGWSGASRLVLRQSGATRGADSLLSEAKEEVRAAGAEAQRGGRASGRARIRASRSPVRQGRRLPRKRGDGQS